jgi:hypothetical protein
MASPSGPRLGTLADGRMTLSTLVCDTCNRAYDLPIEERTGHVSIGDIENILFLIDDRPDSRKQIKDAGTRYYDQD